MPYDYAEVCTHERHDLRDPALEPPLLTHPLDVVRVLRDADRAAGEVVVEVDGREAPALVFWWLDGDGRVERELACFDPSQARHLAEPLGELVSGVDADRDEDWGRRFAERLAELWSFDVAGFVDELFASDCVVENRLRDAPSVHGRVALHGSEARLAERLPVGHRTMRVDATVCDGDALAVLFTVTVGDRSSRGGIVLTLGGDDRVVSDRVYWDPDAVITRSNP